MMQAPDGVIAGDLTCAGPVAFPLRWCSGRKPNWRPRWSSRCNSGATAGGAASHLARLRRVVWAQPGAAGSHRRRRTVATWPRPPATRRSGRCASRGMADVPVPTCGPGSRPAPPQAKDVKGRMSACTQTDRATSLAALPHPGGAQGADRCRLRRPTGAHQVASYRR